MEKRKKKKNPRRNCQQKAFKPLLPSSMSLARKPLYVFMLLFTLLFDKMTVYVENGNIIRKI